MMIEGKKVVDARKPLALEITPKDVKDGNKKEPGNCAAAVACKRQLGVQDVKVHLSSIYVDMGDKYVRYTTPAALRTEIVSFDRGAEFSPGNYTLRPKSPTNRLGVRAKPSGPKKGHKKQRAAPHVVTNVRASAHRNVWVARKEKS